MTDKEDIAKKTINQTLDFLKYKVNSDACTAGDLDAILGMFKENLNIIGTVEDFAKFFNVSEQQVRNTISRRVTDKPKRRVYYRFPKVVKNVPDKWLKDK